MWDRNSVRPKIETGFAFSTDINYVYVEAFNNEIFNQDGVESALLRIKYHNPSNLIFQFYQSKKKLKT